MGQFSWFSVDTLQPIYNDKPIGSQIVTMVYKDREGNIKRVTEDNYEGYGEFGNIDFYHALAWMNNIEGDTDDAMREAAIDFYFDESTKNAEYPQLFLDEPPSDEEIDFSVIPEHDPNQGWSHRMGDNDYDDFDNYYDDDDDYYDDYDDDYDDDDDEEGDDDDDDEY